MKNQTTISRQQLDQQLRELGIRPGGVLLVHCAFSQVKPVADGPIGLIRALRAVLGGAGTLVMPSMTDNDDTPFEVEHTPCHGMGVVADTFWRQPGVLRSNSPHAFAAQGPAAADITAPHPIDIPHGLDSPVGRVYEAHGQILLLGVGHDANTTIHLAEWLAGVRYRRPKTAPIWEQGEIKHIAYGEIDHCCQNFALVDGWLAAQARQLKGTVGYAEARLMWSHDVVKVVTEQLQQNETTFLHPYGVDEECDEARASLA